MMRWEIPGSRLRAPRNDEIIAPSPRRKFLGQHENLARARHIRPAAIEFGNQRLQLVAAGATLERGLVGELVTRLMHGRIAHAPEPPRLPGAERLYGVGQMLPLIPLIKRLAFGGIGDGGANDEKGCWHGRFSLGTGLLRSS